MAKAPKRPKQRGFPDEPGGLLAPTRRPGHRPGLATALHVKHVGKRIGAKFKLAKASKKRPFAAGPSSALPPTQPQTPRALLATSLDAGQQVAVAPKKRKQQASNARGALVLASIVVEDRLARLNGAIQAMCAGQQASPRTAKLLAAGVPKMAQKVVEEAAEVAIDAVRGEPAAVVSESADLLYNLVVLWSALGVAPDEVWAEMDRREAMLGMAEKLPKADEAVE